jgi:hypothetical protein
MLTIDTEAMFGEMQVAFVTAACQQRQAVIRALRRKLPHLTDEEADLAFVDAVIRCLSNDDYLRFDPHTLSLKGGFGLVALSCADHLLRPLMVPAPTTTKPEKRVKVRFVPLPSQEGDRHVPEAFQSADVAEAVMRRDWVEKGLSCLTEEERRAIYAYFWKELRGAALAKALDVAEGHAKKPVNRAIKHLHRALTMLLEEPSLSYL